MMASRSWYVQIRSPHRTTCVQSAHVIAELQSPVPTVARMLTLEPHGVRRCAARAGGEPDWEGTRAAHDMLFLGYSVHHPAHGSVYVGFNPHHYAFDVAIPDAPVGSAWTRIADTALPAPNDFAVQPGAPAEPIQACSWPQSCTMHDLHAQASCMRESHGCV